MTANYPSKNFNSWQANMSSEAYELFLVGLAGLEPATP